MSGYGKDKDRIEMLMRVYGDETSDIDNIIILYVCVILKNAVCRGEEY